MTLENLNVIFQINKKNNVYEELVIHSTPLKNEHMLVLKILLSIRKGEADSITEIHTKTPSMTDHNIYQVMECKVSSDLRLATVFPNGSLFAWIGLGHLWSFQSHKKWLVLSLQLKKRKESSI